MDLLQEIRDQFATGVPGATRISSLPDQVPAWTVHTDKEYGVAVPFFQEKAFSESFENCRILDANFSIQGEPYTRYLLLTTDKKKYWYEFAVVCAQFVEPGLNNETREQLLENPREWWNRWRGLLGDSASIRKPYAVLGELVALKTLYQRDKSITWTAAYAGTHDIESDTASYEVKSTVMKSKRTVTIHSPYQLQSDRSLFLYFICLEESQAGISINSIVKDLVECGYDEEKINEQLASMGYPRGVGLRDIRYKTLERLSYQIDDKFPRITPESFKDGKLPEHIEKIEYTVNLSGLTCEVW